MSDKILAPVDQLTRLPLPVLPPVEVLANSTDIPTNWHHHYHPSNSRLLTSKAGIAVRHVRLQLLPVELHNTYHSIFEGPSLPRTNEQRFGQIIIAATGYIPPFAIDVLANDPSQPVELSEDVRHRLQASGEIVTKGQSNISEFMKNYLVSRDLSHVNETVIEEFLETSDILRKRFLGHWLLAMASEVAAEPLMPLYRQALDEGLIVDRGVKLPNLVKKHVNGRQTSKKAISSLHKSLDRQRRSLQTGVNRVQLVS